MKKIKKCIHRIGDDCSNKEYNFCDGNCNDTKEQICAFRDHYESILNTFKIRDVIELLLTNPHLFNTHYNSVHDRIEISINSNPKFSNNPEKSFIKENN